MPMEKVLITGANGYLGARLAEQLQSGYDVIGLVRSQKKMPFESVVHDLSSPDQLEVDFDAAIHVAAMEPDACRKDPVQAERTNVFGTIKLLEAARKNKAEKFIYASTGSVYGPNEKPARETMAVNCQDAYCRTKYGGELAARRFSRFFPVCTLRYFFPYGPGTHPSRLVQRMVKHIQTGQPVELNNGNRPQLNPLYIDDVVAATRLALEQDTGAHAVLNVAGEEKTDIRDLAEKIGRALGGKKPVFKRTGKTCSNYLADITELKKTGFRQRYSLEEGILKTVQATA
ncbi:NAD(P)-dependent oxidoreductase [Candidatus Micrarchaeota archaeon]|nr:NAD(P)-dependent oxidoreductase [Candidatus Micrarchaeota archaeon]